MKRTMKQLVAATALAGSLVFAGLASAESLFTSPNASAQVTFYGADPATGAEALATTRVNNSPAAVTVEGIEEATYATISYGGESYTFALAESGQNKNEVMLEVASTSTQGATLVSDTGTLSLAELMDGLAADATLLEGLQSTMPVS